MYNLALNDELKYPRTRLKGNHNAEGEKAYANEYRWRRNEKNVDKGTISSIQREDLVIRNISLSYRGIWIR